MFPFTTLLVPLEIARAYAEAFFPGPYVAPKLSSSQANSSKDGAAIPINSAKPMSTQFYDTQVSTVYFQILFTKRNLEAILDNGTVLVTSAMTDSGFASWQISLFIQRLDNPGIPKPVDWTDEEAVELAVQVYPPRTPDGARKAYNVNHANAAAEAAVTAADKLDAATNASPPLSCAELDCLTANLDAALAKIPVERIIGLKPENLKYLQVDYQVISTFDRKPARYDAEQVEALREIAAAIKIKR
jgi:hypothetical protein